ncbi:uncharacterized protein TNCV_2714961 [Trichonephila clavipes]|nr:uncharacterized protein TNCV_2714961 [Trichonephila clavipes]
MYLWIENSIRGGICFVGKRYALANNPFIPGFNKHEEESYIIAVDANNLYLYAMSQPLPIGHFFWLTKDEVAAIRDISRSCLDPNAFTVLNCIVKGHGSLSPPSLRLRLCSRFTLLAT